MTEFSTEEVVRQSLRSLVHELAMGLLASTDKNGRKQLVQTKTKSYIRSVEFLRKLYENPTRHLSKILSDAVVAGQASVVSPKEQRNIIVSYLHEVSKMKPPAVRDWEILRHYLFFFYRQFTSPDPNDDDSPTPPAFFMREIRDVIERLMVEDATQLFLRLFALIREFIQTAQQFFQIDIESEDNLDEEYYFTSMLKYYGALSKAAEGLAPILPELENLLMRKYKINWVLFNKSLFYHYFYKKGDIKERMKKVRKELDHPPEPDSPENRVRREVQNIEDCWYMCVLKITSDRESMAIKDPDIIERNAKMMSEHKKILKTNFWLIRTLEQKLVQDMTLLDSQLVLWVGDTVHTSEKLMNWKGQCICEDCMLVEYETGKHLPPFIRLIACKTCYSGVPIGDYISHIIIKHLPAEKKTEFVRKELTAKKKLPNKKLTTKFCKLLAEAAEAVKAEEQPQFKIPPEKKITENGKLKLEHNIPHFKVSDGTETVLQNTPDENKETDGGLKLGTEAEDVMNTMPEADTFRMMAATLQNMVISKAEQEKAKKGKKIQNGGDEKCEHLDEAACVVSSSSSSSKTNSRMTATCSHSNCKHLDDPQSEDKKSCPYGCDHHKELKKCDCTYCEVFGTSVSMHSHKNNETRDRLRSRLNQRKEKYNGTAGCSPYPNTAVKNPSKPLATTSKIIVNSNKKLEKPPCPILVPSRHNSVPRTVSEPDMGEESNGQASLPRSLADSKAENSGLHQSIFSMSTCSLDSLIQDEAARRQKNADSRDIDDLLNYILGNKNVDKAALAKKKAAKKARQRQKREQEKLRLEEEERRKVEERAREEKRKEEERLKAEALAKELAEKTARKNKKAENDGKKQQKEVKKSNKINKKPKAKQEERELLMEETIPAMVTIKRVIENDNSPPTVTITLKGSTPDQDKLLYTLVNGYNKNKEQSTVKQEKSSKNKKKNKTQTKSAVPVKVAEPIIKVATKNKKNKNGVKTEETTKEVKLTFAVDKPAINKETNKFNENNKKNKPEEKKKREEKKKLQEEKKKQPPQQQQQQIPISTVSKQKQKMEKPKLVENKKDEKDIGLNIPMLRLPPGITITKVDGPVANRNRMTPPAHHTHHHHHQSSNNIHNSTSHHHQSSRVPMSKSGVIVVDTEKLIQQSAAIISNKKRKKKNKKEKAAEQKDGCNGADKAAPSMITLKNPIFHTLQTTLANKVTEKLAPEVPVMPCNQQASIIKNDNGMVTIRSPRLQQSLNSGTPIPNLLTELKPVIGPELTTCHTSFSDNSRISSLNAQEILSGLPGIEITKVDKKNTKVENDTKKSCQAADVSIIPTTNGNFNDKFSFDRDDWHYESVFTPKDILEDDLDAEERELEAFKRFCQQSVPPKRKEKVAHLNVKDIVLIKKNDVTYI